MIIVNCLLVEDTVNDSYTFTIIKHGRVGKMDGPVQLMRYEYGILDNRVHDDRRDILLIKRRIQPQFQHDFNGMLTCRSVKMF